MAANVGLYSAYLLCLLTHPCSVRDTKFPRPEALQDLLDIIKKHPTFGKDAATALVTIAEAMRVNASEEEIAILIKSTVSQEAYLRNASLQCLQVRMGVFK